jgi:hypothetical protein
MKKSLMLIMTAFLFTACAHHRDVRPGVNGVHRVVLQCDDRQQGAREAISEANHFCEQNGRHAAFLKERQKYSGSMDENSYRTAKGITRGARTAGVMGARNRSSSNLGLITVSGGMLSVKMD